MISTAPARRKLDELIARYRFEPALRDVFVEGRTDANLLNRFLSSHDLSDVAVYEISTVEITAAELVASGYPDSARGRVIFLAFHCEGNLPPDSRAITCVADRDFDVLLGRTHDCSFLLFWDHATLEMYAFTPELVSALLRSVAPGLQKEGRAVLTELEPMLKKLFVIRTANIQLGLGLEWLASFSDSCELLPNSVKFDEEDFINRYLNKNARLSERGRLVAAIDALTQRAAGDPRQFIRGHDFVAAFSWYLRENAAKSSVLHRQEVLHRLLLAHLEPSRLENEGFFRRLIARVQSGSVSPAAH